MALSEIFILAFVLTHLITVIAQFKIAKLICAHPELSNKKVKILAKIISKTNFPKKKR